MSRAIPQLGPPPPRVEVRPTLDTGDWSGLDGIFPAKNFPWNNRLDTSGTPVDPAKGEVPITFPKADGTYAPAKFTRKYGDDRQIIINSEDQFYVDEALLAEYGLDPLTRIVDGVCEMDCIPTPVVMQDVALRSNANDYTITEVDEAAGTITIAGLRWRCTEPSIDGSTYRRGNHYRGFDTYIREELVDDVHHFANHREQFAYSIAQLKSPTFSDRDFRYTSVVSLDRNGNLTASDAEDESNTGVSRHVLTVQPGSIPAGAWPVAGDRIKPQPRLPWIAPMHSSQSAFAQNGGVWEAEAQLDDHYRQFFAIFFWSNYFKSDGRDGFQAVSVPKQQTDDTEIDFLECPGGDAHSIVRHFHNIHAPITGGMANHASVSGRPSVLPGTEWTEDKKQQHLGVIRRNDPDFVSYTEGFFKIRLYWWPEGNPEGKPGNSVEWYVLVPGRGWKRFGGALSPPWTAAGEPFSPKCIFMNNAVWGEFVTGNAYQYDVNGNSPNDGDKITNRIRSMKVWQFVDSVAGGSGLPDENGDYPNGFAPTPGDQSGGSGTGVVRAGVETVVLESGSSSDALSIVTLVSSSVTVPVDQVQSLALSSEGADITAGSSNPSVVRVTGTSPRELFIYAQQEGVAFIDVYATNKASGRITKTTMKVTVGNGGSGIPTPDASVAVETEAVRVTVTGATNGADVARYLVDRDNVQLAAIPGRGGTLLDAYNDLTTPRERVYSITAESSAGELSATVQRIVSLPAVGDDAIPTPVFTAEVSGSNVRIAVTPPTSTDNIARFRVSRDGVAIGVIEAEGGALNDPFTADTTRLLHYTVVGEAVSGQRGLPSSRTVNLPATGAPPPKLPSGDRLVNTYVELEKRLDGTRILAPSADALPPTGAPSGETTVLASTTDNASGPAPASGVIPTDLPNGADLTPGSTHTRWYSVGVDVVWSWSGASWLEVARRSLATGSAGGGGGGSGVVIRLVQANRLERGSVAYRALIDDTPVTSDDVDAGARLVLRDVAPDESGSTTDHFLASTDETGAPVWEEID